ncbi:Sec-independent protein translocase subunit TatA [Actinomycetospora sp. OC33-EN08]|uniref:Sec-independent protein translocase protein TatA n=1 Tax=Actinomycetospora aurantiaca TaxID=3129233 RepID=A0ABU8MW77_9PSEU
MSEWIIVAVVGVVLLFSAKKLPDMARGLGQSMRIFKAETRGMKEDDAKARTTDEPAPKPVEASAPVVEKPRETVPDEARKAE